MPNLDEYRDVLSNKNKLIDNIEAIIDYRFRKPLSHEYEELIIKKLKCNVTRNINIVFYHAQSEVEKIFLNALIFISCVYENPYFLTFMNPFLAAQEEMDAINTKYIHIAEDWSKQEHLLGEKAFEELVAYVNNSLPSNVDKETFIDHVLDFLIFNHQEIFHVSLHSTFTDTKFKGQYVQPDVLIWFPINPSFKIIIESDGFGSFLGRLNSFNDKAREHFLHTRGFQVLRFSSKEILNDPFTKAKHLHDYLVAQKPKLLEKKQASLKVDDYKAVLLSKDKMYLLVDSYFEKMMNYVISDMGNDDQIKAYLRKNQQEQMRSSVNIIFSHAESDLEKIFLNVLLSLFYSSSPFSCYLTNPIYSITEEINHIRTFYGKCLEMWSEFCNFTKQDGLASLYPFMDYINSNRDIPEETKNLIINFTFSNTLFHCYHKYHISIQSTFTDIKVNGRNIRPDIFIWIPAKPNFKLIVECDGYHYHSDKEAFSNDRARDRALQIRGFQVLRFSSQEIFNDPFAKAEELYDYLINQKTKQG